MPLLHPSEVVLLNRLCDIGFRFSRLEEFAQECDSSETGLA